MALTEAAESSVAAADDGTAGESLLRSFHIQSTARVILVIINPFAGERPAAEALFRACEARFGEHRVVELTPALFADPAPLRDAMLRGHADRPIASRGRSVVVAAGGDGTISFVLGVIDATFSVADPMKPELDASRPAVVVVPLGTANDLSRALGTGDGFTSYPCCCFCCPTPIDRMINIAARSPIVPLDRWEVTVSDGPADRPRRLYRGNFSNYFSFGLDAAISRRFDAARRTSSCCYSLRCLNKLLYGCHSMAASCGAGTFARADMSLVVDSVPVTIPASCDNCKIVIFSNLPSYAGGTSLWDAKNVAAGGATEALIDDGRLELQTIGGLWHLTGLQLGLTHADGITQGTTFTLRIQNPADASSSSSSSSSGGPMMQADGEPLPIDLEHGGPFQVDIRPSRAGRALVHMPLADASRLAAGGS